MLMFQNGQPQILNFGNTTNLVDGLLWVDPSFQVVIFMDHSIRDSVFTNMFFFNGDGNKELGISKLNNFELVYQNSEIKLFKVTF